MVFLAHKKSITQNKKTALFFIMAVFLISIDRLLKSSALQNWQANPVQVTDWFKLDFALNQNIAFSLPVYGILLNIVIIILIIILIYKLILMVQKKQAIISGLLFVIILGATSNLLDRFLYGGVIDYFDFAKFTIFNLADAMICIGIILLIWIGWQQPKQS
jgi:signal peptidase II